jgi:hypothetical protein
VIRLDQTLCFFHFGFEPRNVAFQDFFRGIISFAGGIDGTADALVLGPAVLLRGISKIIDDCLGPFGQFVHARFLPTDWVILAADAATLGFLDRRNCHAPGLSLRLRFVFLFIDE